MLFSLILLHQGSDLKSSSLILLKKTDLLGLVDENADRNRFR
ncbi:hypothetical protein HanPI659440_Chr04g0160281 [Helianthus annuus]|nr:hypothetical protein HanPI659440_Chr04g0160281 [Helianthus annuus]